MANLDLDKNGHVVSYTNYDMLEVHESNWCVILKQHKVNLFSHTRFIIQ